MDVISGFKDTFNELLKESDKTIKQVSIELNTSPFVVLKWKHKLTDVKLKSLIKLADYFDCSVEFLCGKTKRQKDFEPRRCPPFGERMVKVLKEKGCSTYRLFKDTAIKPAQYHHWRKGTEPLLSSLETVAEYLGVTLDYLIGRDPETT